jgi:hypothetical protein
VKFIESTTFQRNLSLPFSGLENRASCKPAEATRKMAQFARKRAKSLNKLLLIQL